MALTYRTTDSEKWGTGKQVGLTNDEIDNNFYELFIAASSDGTVKSIVAGTGLSGDTITTTGTISLADTDVIAGTYTTADITVDAQGRITAAASGISGAGSVRLTSDTIQEITSDISIIGNLTVIGTTTSTDFNSTSDARFKKDLEKITDALSKVKSLTGYTYTLIETNERSTGLLAQDVELVQPESVSGTDDKKTLSYGSMMGLIVEAIKELDMRLSEIQNQISNK